MGCNEEGILQSLCYSTPLARGRRSNYKIPLSLLRRVDQGYSYLARSWERKNRPNHLSTLVGIFMRKLIKQTSLWSSSVVIGALNSVVEKSCEPVSAYVRSNQFNSQFNYELNFKLTHRHPYPPLISASFCGHFSIVAVLCMLLGTKKIPCSYWCWFWVLSMSSWDLYKHSFEFGIAPKYIVRLELHPSKENYVYYLYQSCWFDGRKN